MSFDFDELRERSLAYIGLWHVCQQQGNDSTVENHALRRRPRWTLLMLNKLHASARCASPLPIASAVPDL